MGFKILLFTFAALVATTLASEKKVICYYGTWATYRAEPGKFDVDDINLELCTHLVYTFVGINETGHAVSLDTFLDLPDGKDTFNKFNALKKKNTNLKTILAVGGWNEGSAKYSNMTASAEFRHNFITSILDFITTYGFNGCDLDWEYPARRDSTHGQADIDNFSTLLKEMRTEFDKHGLLLSAAVAAVGEFAKLSYDIPTISGYLDWVGLMTYDMYGAFNVTGYNAALYQGEIKANYFTVKDAVEYWLTEGCPAEKLVIGVPFYGRTFTLEDPEEYSVGSLSSGAGLAGPFTQEAGNIGYNELCAKFLNETWIIQYDFDAQVPFTHKDNNWVSYDNYMSLTEKVKFAIEKDVAGVMIWSIETDDFHGTCGEAYPLLKAVNRAYGRIETPQQ